MERKIKCVLLVDDDDATNYIHDYVIKEANFAEDVKIVGNGQEALDYLRGKDKEDYIRPDLILLDINMPVMNGWEFIEEYKKMDGELQGEMMVVMLTTSLNPDDEMLSKKTGNINKFMIKPLTVEMLEELQVHFATLKKQ